MLVFNALSSLLEWVGVLRVCGNCQYRMCGEGVNRTCSVVGGGYTHHLDTPHARPLIFSGSIVCFHFSFKGERLNRTGNGCGCGCRSGGRKRCVVVVLWCMAINWDGIHPKLRRREISMEVVLSKKK